MNRTIILFLLSILLYPDIAQCSLLDKKLSKTICGFSKIMDRKGLKTIGTGGGYKDGKIREVAIRLHYDGIMDLQTARALLVDITNQYTDYINDNHKLNCYFLEPSVTNRSLNLIISGEEPIDLSSDYIRSAGLIEGRVAYWKSHPDPHTFHSITVHRETFQEAVAIVNANQASCSCQDTTSLKVNTSPLEKDSSDTPEFSEAALASP